MGTLRIYTDENIDVRVAEGLRRRGVHAFSALERKMTGATDMEHLQYAAETQSVLFTHDHHFLEITSALTVKGEEHWGVIYVEMNRLSPGECIKRLSLYAEVLSSEEMKNAVEFL